MCWDSSLSNVIAKGKQRLHSLSRQFIFCPPQYSGRLQRPTGLNLLLTSLSLVLFISAVEVCEGAMLNTRTIFSYFIISVIFQGQIYISGVEESGCQPTIIMLNCEHIRKMKITHNFRINVPEFHERNFIRIGWHVITAITQFREPISMYKVILALKACFPLLPLNGLWYYEGLSFRVPIYVSRMR